MGILYKRSGVPSPEGGITARCRIDLVAEVRYMGQDVVVIVEVGVSASPVWMPAVDHEGRFPFLPALERHRGLRGDHSGGGQRIREA